MQAFLRKFSNVVRGVLNGFDRLVFRGTLRNLCYCYGLQNYLWANRIPFKDFHHHSLAITKQLEEASQRYARETGREIRYLNNAKIEKEAVAREIAARDGITSGLICVLRSVDPCMSFAIHRNSASKHLEISYRERKCIHLYHYQMHPVFGFMHARIQTWFPFRVYVCLNGREWLARQMDQAGLHYQQRDNCFPWLEDVSQAQALFDQQLRANWRILLGELANSLNPIHHTIFARYPTQYYWSVAQSEWASDVMFRSRADLEAPFPRWLRYAVTNFHAVDILRFLGRRIRPHGKVPARFAGEVETSLKEREEGVRIKHWYNHNSLKLYDKGSVLRPECTINNPEDFLVYRPAEGDPEGPKAWRTLRYGVADLHRRSVVCQAANERYLDALAAIGDTTPVRQLAEPLCRPVVERTPTPRCTPSEPPTEVTKPSRPRRFRALNPLATADATLLEAISHHDFLINGLRNRDLRRLLYPSETTDPKEQRRRSAAVGRKLRLLRAHGLLHKVPKTHRYMVSSNGRKAITALLAARDANTDLLTASAA